MIVVILIIVVGVATVRNPEFERVGTAVVGALVLVMLFAPYVAGDWFPRSLSVTGVFIASVGAYGLLVGTTRDTLFWVLAIGGMLLLVQDQYRRLSGRGRTDETK